MADKQISDLVAATSVQAADLFVLEQTGTAKKLTGQILINWMTAYADGHGGIQSIAKTGTSGLIDTYTITYADTTTSTFTVTNGAKGDTGDSWYVWLKYAADLPTQDSDMGDAYDNWIGIYSGTSSTPPTSYTAYTWKRLRGDTGATGEAATITSYEVGYMYSSSGSQPPEGSWSTTVPEVQVGMYLWTRVVTNYNDGTTVRSYSVSRIGQDGSGSVSSVNGVPPTAGTTNVQITASNIQTSDSDTIQAHITQIESDVSDLATYEVRHITGNITSLPKSFSYSFITANHRVINCVLGTPSALASDLTWTTSAGGVTFSGSLVNLGTTTIDFDIVKVVTP